MKQTNNTPAAKKLPKELRKFIVKIKLSESVLFQLGFEKIKRATYLQEGIEIKKEGKDKFYFSPDGKKKKYITTPEQLEKIFIDAGKPAPESVDPSGY